MGKSEDMEVTVNPIDVIDLHLSETREREILPALEVRDWLLDLRLLLESRDRDLAPVAGSMS